MKMAESRHEIWFLRLEDNKMKCGTESLSDRIRLLNWESTQTCATNVEACLHLVPELERILKGVNPDLIHAGPVQSCGFMTALTGFRPFLVMSWGSDILVDSEQSEMWRWTTRYTLRNSDMLLCDCQAVRTKVQELVSYEEERIIQFPWGVDLLMFTPGVDHLGLRRNMGWEDKFIILCTRSWEQIYGIGTVLEAFDQAYSANNRLRLIMLGSGSLAPTIERFISNHNLNQVVHRPGMVRHEYVTNYFKASDLYLSCSHSDGTSVSLLEAMASGLPVVVTDGPGNREWVVSGENGWLAPASDTRAFARKILLAADLDRVARRQICRSNRLKAEKRANWDVNFTKLLDAYEQMEIQTTR